MRAMHQANQNWRGPKSWKMVVGVRYPQRMWTAHGAHKRSIQGAIKPHGGRLVNRSSQKNTAGMFSISVSEDLAKDVENIADGILSPLEGFIVKSDFDSV